MPTLERLRCGGREWDDALRRFPDYTVYQTSAWLDFVAATQDAEPVRAVLREGDRTVGYFAGLLVRKFGLRILGSPLPGWSTFYMGMNLAPEVCRRTALQALERFAFRDLKCAHFELMDRSISVEEAREWGYEHRALLTFEIDLTQPKERIFADMSKSCRWCVRKAERNGVIVEEANDPQFADDYYDQLIEVFAKQSLVPSYGRERVRAMIEHIHPTGQLLLCRARDADGRCIGTGLFPAMNRIMSFWGGASWRKYRGLLPNEAIQWFAIRYWKARGIARYDMGGGGEYKRKYGGREIHVPWLRKSKSRSLATMRNLAQRAFRWRQRLLGRLSRRRGVH